MTFPEYNDYETYQENQEQAKRGIEKMGLIVKQEQSGGSFEPIEAGLHLSVCYGVIDLGTHYNPTWDKRQRKVLIMWELPDVRIDVEKDGQTVNLPRVLSNQYTLSLHEKSELYKHLISWRGKPFTPQELDGFNLFNIVGAPCQIQVMPVERSGKTYTNITSIVSAPKGYSPTPGKSQMDVFI
jgi:hypothetical protein